MNADSPEGELVIKIGDKTFTAPSCPEATFSLFIQGTTFDGFNIGGHNIDFFECEWVDREALCALIKEAQEYILTHTHAPDILFVGYDVEISDNLIRKVTKVV